jgi:L-ascorbate metabolism protein UlaG (beta-lactamase superfamily)
MNRWYKNGKALLDEIAASRPQPDETYIWFMGQHGFIINLSGTVFYIDVILNGLFDEDGNSIRVYAPPFAPDEIQIVDYVLCTHNHIDHLNLETLLPLAASNPKTRFIVPEPCKRFLCEAGIDESCILAARSGQNLYLKNSILTIPVPAIHTKYIQDDGEKDGNGDYSSVGFILKGNGLSIYHSGDSWVTPVLIDALKAHGPLNIAMLPINGSDWERTSGNCIGNMNSLDAAKLAGAVPIDLVIPSHYDMIAYNSENPAAFANIMYTLYPHKRFHICALGERFIYKWPQKSIFN